MIYVASILPVGVRQWYKMLEDEREKSGQCCVHNKEFTTSGLRSKRRTTEERGRVERGKIMKDEIHQWRGDNPIQCASAVNE